jgi:hypothetical protein
MSIVDRKRMMQGNCGQMEIMIYVNRGQETFNFIKYIFHRLMCVKYFSFEKHPF